MGATTSTAVRPWQDLPPDVVREISSRLHTAIDLVRFHAVCKPWRSSFDPASRHPPSLLPWLLAPSDKHCRCVFSGTSYRAPLRIRAREDGRVACADGTAAWLVRGKDEDWLVNPLTAARLPGVSLGDSRRTCKWLDRTHRVVSGDGTILVHGGFAPYTHFPGQYALPGLILKPGHQEWRSVELYTGSARHCAAAYHDNVAVYLTGHHCHVIQPFQFREEVPLPSDPDGKFCWRRYLVEFLAGELLLVISVLRDTAPVNGRVMSVSLHALDLIKAGQQEAYVIRDCDAASLLRDHVLFLGFPSSFAVEASRFGGEVSGGTAYFVAEPRVGRCNMYRHDFHVGRTTVVQNLPRPWGSERCMWFLPQPDIAPIVTRPRRLTIYAGDLPPNVNNDSRLREMFNKYGKVASTRIAYDKKRRSRGFGFVTMATQEGFDRAIAAHAAVEPEQGTAGFSKSVVAVVILLLLVFAYYYVFGHC